MLPCTQRAKGEGGGNSNTHDTAHAVMIGSQGLGNRLRLKNTVHLRSVHDPVNDVTSNMSRLDNRLRETEDVEDVDYLCCAGLIRAIKVKVHMSRND